jgi:hypothetical protein
MLTGCVLFEARTEFKYYLNELQLQRVKLQSCVRVEECGEIFITSSIIFILRQTVLG